MVSFGGVTGSSIAHVLSQATIPDDAFVLGTSVSMASTGSITMTYIYKP